MGLELMAGMKIKDSNLNHPKHGSYMAVKVNENTEQR